MRKLLFLASVLAGCAVQHPAAPEPGVTASGTLALRDSAGRHLEAVVSPWTKADIDHVNLSLFTGANATATAVATIKASDLSASVSFNNLVRNTSYHVVAKAYHDLAESTEIDNFAVSASTCTTTFATTNDDVVSIGAIGLQLVNVTFAGTGSSSGLTVTDGTVVDTTATQAIQVGP